jgi:hypothetical protein
MSVNQNRAAKTTTTTTARHKNVFIQMGFLSEPYIAFVFGWKGG